MLRIRSTLCGKKLHTQPLTRLRPGRKKGSVQKQQMLKMRIIPAINVIVEGGWSGSLMSGTGIAVFVQFLNARINSALTHKCFKNWSGFSLAMEKYIIIEGFKQSELTHGIHYTGLSGD